MKRGPGRSNLNFGDESSPVIIMGEMGAGKTIMGDSLVLKELSKISTPEVLGNWGRPKQRRKFNKKKSIQINGEVKP